MLPEVHDELESRPGPRFLHDPTRDVIAVAGMVLFALPFPWLIGLLVSAWTLTLPSWLLAVSFAGGVAALCVGSAMIMVGRSRSKRDGTGRQVLAGLVGLAGGFCVAVVIAFIGFRLIEPLEKAHRARRDAEVREWTEEMKRTREQRESQNP